MDTLNMKKKQEAEKELIVFFPRCTKRHLRNECPLDVIEIYSICEEKCSTEKCPSFLGLKVMYRGAGGGMEYLFFVNQKRPQGPIPYQKGMNYPSSFNKIYNV